MAALETTNDRGPFFKNTYAYNPRVVAPEGFNWNLSPQGFVSISNNIPIAPGEDTSRIRIMQPVTYGEILDIVAHYKPTILYVRRGIRHDINYTSPTTEPIQYVSLKTIIFMGDLNMGFIEEYFPTIERIYCAKFSGTQTPPSGHLPHGSVILDNLRLFTTNLAFISEFSKLKMPNLEHLDIYNIDDGETKKMKITMEFPKIKILRLDSKINIRVDKGDGDELQFITSDNLEILQYFHREDRRYVFLPAHIENILNCIKLWDPIDLILPPIGIDTASIETHILNTKKLRNLGVYVNDPNIKFFTTVRNLNIYDPGNIHAAASLRLGVNASNYLQRAEVYKKKFETFKKFYGDEKAANDLLLININLYDPIYRDDWNKFISVLNEKNGRRPIIITQNEIIKEDPFSRFGVVLDNKTQVLMVDYEKKYLLIDMTANTTTTIVEKITSVITQTKINHIDILIRGCTVNEKNLISRLNAEKGVSVKVSSMCIQSLSYYKS